MPPRSNAHIWAAQINNVFPGGEATARQIWHATWGYDVETQQSAWYRIKQAIDTGLLNVRVNFKNANNRRGKVGPNGSTERPWLMHPSGRDVCLDCPLAECVYVTRQFEDMPPGCPIGGYEY